MKNKEVRTIEVIMPSSDARHVIWRLSDLPGCNLMYSSHKHLDSKTFLKLKNKHVGLRIIDQTDTETRMYFTIKGTKYTNWYYTSIILAILDSEKVAKKITMC